MPNCEMWCNGFLQTLEVKPGFLLDPSGFCRINTGGVEHTEARLIGGWIITGRTLAGLTCKAMNGRKYSILVTHCEPDTWRRLLVRLRWPDNVK